MLFTPRGLLAAVALLAFFASSAVLMVEAVLLMHLPVTPGNPHTGNAHFALMGTFLSAVVAVFALHKPR